MKTSPQGVEFIASHEGVVTKAYRDVAGVWTIGVGHTAAAGGIKPKAGMEITREDAFTILAGDLPQYEASVERTLAGKPLTEPVNDGCVSFDFNTGAIDRASWVKSFLAGDAVTARARLGDWNKAGGKVVGGLVKRRADEGALIFDGRYNDGWPAVDWQDVRQKLTALGYLPTKNHTLGEAVVDFQHANGLNPDGIVGKATSATLARRYAEWKATQAIGGTTAASGVAGAGVETTGGSGHAWLSPDTLLAGGKAAVAVAVIGLCIFLVWHFRGVIFGRLRGR